MNNAMPFPIRGSEEWDQREMTRFAQGCRCISYGLPADVNDRRPINSVVRMPSPARLAELRAVITNTVPL